MISIIPSELYFNVNTNERGSIIGEFSVINNTNQTITWKIRTNRRNRYGFTPTFACISGQGECRVQVQLLELPKDFDKADKFQFKAIDEDLSELINDQDATFRARWNTIERLRPQDFTTITIDCHLTPISPRTSISNRIQEQMKKNGNNKNIKSFQETINARIQESKNKKRTGTFSLERSPVVDNPLKNNLLQSPTGKFSIERELLKHQEEETNNKKDNTESPNLKEALIQSPIHLPETETLNVQTSTTLLPETLNHTIISSPSSKLATDNIKIKELLQKIEILEAKNLQWKNQYKQLELACEEHMIVSDQRMKDLDGLRQTIFNLEKELNTATNQRKNNNRGLIMQFIFTVCVGIILYYMFQSEPVCDANNA